MLNPEILNYRIVVQKWEESERGWGTRPDGYSLHLSHSDRRLFIQKYWESMPKKVPDEYSRPDGTPYIADINENEYQEVLKSEFGIRKIGTPPGSGGIDGWVFKSGQS